MWLRDKVRFVFKKQNKTYIVFHYKIKLLDLRTDFKKDDSVLELSIHSHKINIAASLDDYTSIVHSGISMMLDKNKTSLFEEP